MKKPLPGNFKSSTLLREANPQVGGTDVAAPPISFLVRYRSNPRLSARDCGPGEFNLSDGQTELRFETEEEARDRAVKLVHDGEAMPGDVTIFCNTWLRPHVSLETAVAAQQAPSR